MALRPVRPSRLTVESVAGHARHEQERTRIPRTGGAIQSAWLAVSMTTETARRERDIRADIAAIDVKIERLSHDDSVFARSEAAALGEARRNLLKELLELNQEEKCKAH